MDSLLQHMAGQTTSCSDGASSTTPAPATGSPVTGQMVLLDMFFPGFSTFSAFVQKNLNIDLNLYIPLVLICGALTFAWQYFSEYCWDLIDRYMMSVVDVRTDDEIYNMLMGWVAAQKFAQGARRFVVNTNLNSRTWWLWRYDYDDEEEDGTEEDGGGAHHSSAKGAGKKALAYTPTFGSHWFWYKGRLLCFRRQQSRDMAGFSLPSEREEISIKCFGRNPWILKELLLEARQVYMKRDEAKTLIYRGATKGSGSEPTWQRCMARTSRPFSTVILNEKVKKELIDDVTDYLNPATRRWYANRGIPYRRGYLLHGPPGTGKSSLSLALAGFFKMRIYIVSLSSIAANEENLASLFSELPRRCVVLLEDIDTAGLTHTREDGKVVAVDGSGSDDMVPGQITPGDGTTTTPTPSGRLSLSGLLNILDGVASQEGRVLIMTTNHLEKLDKALIRPGRVDMIVEFGRADKEMTAAIFRAIFAPLEGDEVDTPSDADSVSVTTTTTTSSASPKDLSAAAEETRKVNEARRELERDEATLKVVELADQFADKIPAHEFSPAEIQGFLLKHKRNAAAAVEGAEQWVVETRKEKMEKELREARERREKEEKEKEEAKKKKEDGDGDQKEKEDDDKEETKEKKAEKKGKKERRSRKHHKKTSRRSRRSRKNDSDSSDDSSSSSSSSSSSDSESESEPEIVKEKKSRRKHAKKEQNETIPPVLVKEDTIKVQVVPVPVVVPVTITPAPEADNTDDLDKAVVEVKDILVPQISVTEVKEVRSTGSEDGKDSGYGTP
ncbi:BCS1 N terminal-domain-containing protein [Neurospora tetraspora]|uniref:BCS1 N terminal-domain-containing protein n=1 Tax=Neurospora tetraspora TaxID=94610 RepID=A0AAE0JDC5_9PEZI|nr:BCS1 N terminal-domain-containing protein [Neurospora tetraspora]